jgi:hypothetical protein
MGALYPLGRGMDISRFKAIFSGLDIAYGTYRIDKTREDGKQEGKAMVVRNPPTDDLWLAHLKGEGPSLGIIPIRADSTCTWGCIDVDQYPLDHKALLQKCRKLELPLVMCRSKSGGAHLFLFHKDPISAAEMQKTLRLYAAYLGYSNCEIFPKQTQILVERGDTGNFLNLPYYGGPETTRYAFDDEGSAVTLEDFYLLYDKYCQSEEAKRIVPIVQDDYLKGAPPCLEVLCAQGFPEGTRNNGLFNVGVFLRKSFPDTWENEILSANQKYMDPPLPLQEINILVKQLKKKDYGYRCSSSPIDAHCNKALCATRDHGVRSRSEGPRIASLSKYNSDPPLWFLNVDGNRVELTTEELQQQAKFQIVCMNKINVAPPTLKKAEWEALLNSLLREMVESQAIQQAPEDTSKHGRFMDLLEEFCTHMQSSMERDEILLGRPWTDEEENLTYFRLKDLEAYLVRNKAVDFTSVKIAQRLRELGGEPLPVLLKKRTTRVWRIPAFKKQEEAFSVTYEKKEPF